VLLVNGAPVQIGSRAFEVLLTLVKHRGTMVTKGELLDAAWPGLVVEENNVSVQVATLRKVLGAASIVTVAGRGYQLSAELLPVKERAADSPTSALPELLGRERDLAAVTACLADWALTTIIGPGGVGKTALAREGFARHCGLVQSSGFWIDLAPIREAQQVMPAIAKSLGIETADSSQDAHGLLVALAQTAAFVALDNCEHQIEEVSRFVDLALSAAPRVRWLATSREALGVRGEHVHRLEPLSVPTGPVTAVQAVEHGSIALLCKRVVESDRRFCLDERNVTAAVMLCGQLDGLPLAIEMAATRVATFGLDEVCRRLGHRLKLLKGGAAGSLPRHQTLKATYDWSFELLSDCEQVVFRRLSPFLGGFRVDMAQRVVSDDDQGGSIDSWAALDAIGALVDKSLVQREADDPGRFYLLESARDYARSHLEAAGETATVLQRHARAVAEWFEPVQSDADRMTDAQWVRRYSPERHNARAALAWACEQQVPDDAAQLVTALSMMDWLLCRQAEVLQCGVPLDLLARATPAKRAAAYLEFSWAHYCDGSHALGARLSEEAFELFSERGDSALAYRALAQLTRLQESRPGMSEAAQAAWQRLQQTDDARLSPRNRIFCSVSAGLANRADYTIERLKELSQLAGEAGFESAAAICGCNLTDRLLMAGRYAEAVATADRLLRSTGSRPRATAFILHNKAAALISLGQCDEAYEAARLAFQTMPSVAHFLIATFALGAAQEGRLTDAAVLHGCGCRIREVNHEALDAWEAGAIAETAARLESGLNATQCAELLKLGAAMSASEVLAIKAFPRVRAHRAMAASPAVAPSRGTSVGAN
jgi:predicted ATPase